MKKLLSTILAAAMAASFATVSAFAADTGITATGVFDEDGDTIETNSGNSITMDSGRVVMDGIAPNQTIYLELGNTSNDPEVILEDGGVARISDLADSDLFKISIDKDGTGKSLIKSVTQVSEKKLDGQTNRGSYLKIILNDTTTTTDLKATATVTFKAKKDMTSSTSGYYGNTWTSGESTILDVTMWINNEKVSGSDGDAETGANIYFSPESNEDNTLIWGDDRAALQFSADDDADDFFARLSTKVDSEIYTEYGDPVDADLWFYDFVGNPTIPSTSRATLTLGIPWDDDEDYVPDPENCFVYTQDADGYLTDVTDQFTYSEDEQEINGWSIKTRTLGTYIISDTELDVYAYEDTTDDTDSTTDETVEDTTAGISSEAGKVIPNTGSSDMVNVAVLGAVLSLATAGAVAFRKASR